MKSVMQQDLKLYLYSSLHKIGSLEHSNTLEEDLNMENKFESISEDKNENREHKQGNWSNVNIYNMQDRSNIKKPLRYDIDFKEAAESQNSENWIEATNNEVKSLEQNGIWFLLNLPKDRTIVNCGWVYKTKYNVHGNVDRYKARLVSKMFGIDFIKTFSSVVNVDLIRSILVISASEKLLQLQQFNV
ncbi:hypothetical protein QTP88_002335 [Uroleucon formosanum]